MRRSSLVLLGVALFAIAEIALVSWVSTQIGIGWTLLLLLAGLVAGALAWRIEGGRVWQSLSQVRDPQGAGRHVTDTFLVFLGGALLMLPGFLSDVVGLVLVVPFTRPLARRGVEALLRAWTKPLRDRADLMEAQLQQHGAIPDGGQVVEGETVPDAPTNDNTPDDQVVIRGEIER